jgi:hypothetical protein
MKKNIYRGIVEEEGFLYDLKIVPVYLDDILIYYSARINDIEFYRVMIDDKGECRNTHGQVDDLSRAIGKAIISNEE